MARTPDPEEAEFVRRVREPRAKSSEPGRHAARRAAMMLLYRADLMDGDVEDAISAFAREYDAPMPDYGATVVRGVAARKVEVDAAIAAHLNEWSVERLGAVERAVLRMAMFELLSGDVPEPVVIDEAVELAKRYASPDAAKLVNGVLGGWVRSGAGVRSGDEEQ